jgi:hypothetical protein
MGNDARSADAGRPGTLRDLVRATEAGGLDVPTPDPPPRVDPLSEWSDEDNPTTTDRGLDADLVDNPIPEADDDETTAAWDDSDAMDGQAPTG